MIVGVHVFVTVCRINVNVWDGVELREIVFVEIDVAVVVEVIECVGVDVWDLDCWIVIVTELDTLEVPVILSDPETVVEELIVFDWLDEPDSVVDPVDVLELDELPENVEVPVCVLDCPADLVNDPDPVIVAVWEGLLVGPGAEERVEVYVVVCVTVLEIRADPETDIVAVVVLVCKVVRVEVEVIEEERVILLTVEDGVKESFNDLDSLGVIVIHDDRVDVFVDAMVRVLLLVLSIDGLDVDVALWVLDKGGDRVNVEEALEVFDNPGVLDWLDEPVEVLLDVWVAVPVRVPRIVLVWRGDLEIEVEAVDVRDPRAENVWHPEDEEVLDNAVVLEFVGLDDPVLDWVVVPVWVLEEVWVLDVVVLPVIVLEDVEESVSLDVDEEVLVIREVLVNCGVGLIVTEGSLVGVGKRVNLDENVDVVVFVEVLDIVPVELGIIPFNISCLSILNSSNGGVELTVPIANNTKSHLIAIYYIR